MRNVGRTVLIFTLATSISALAASRNPDASKASKVNNSTAEATAATAVQDTDQRKSCQPSEESHEQSAQQKLIQEQEKEWLKDLVYNR